MLYTLKFGCANEHQYNPSQNAGILIGLNTTGF